MGNELAIKGGTAMAAFQVPDDIKQELAIHGGNIADRDTTNSLTFGNGAWTMTTNGQKKVLQRRNEDGDMENVQTLRLIVLAYNPIRERSYHDGPYDPANQRAPDCWSKNGRTPDANAGLPQAKSCVECAHGAKGGDCRQHRVLVVVPAGDLAAPALRLRIAVTSDWDKKDEQAMAQGWYGFNNYADFLRDHGVSHTGILVTRVRFDPNPNITFSKIQFARGDFLSAEQRAIVYERAKSEEVLGLLNQNWSAPRAEQTGKSLPRDEAPPVGDPVFSKTGAAAQAAQDAENARLKEHAAMEAAERQAARERAYTQEQEAKAAALAVAATDKARKAAELKAQLAALEAEETAPTAPVETAPAFDDAPKPQPLTPATASDPQRPTADTSAPKRQTRKAKEEPVAPSVPVEVPDALKGMMDAWG